MSEAALRGSLGSFKLADVLTLLSMSRKSGTLILTSQERRASVVFVNGGVVYAGSTQEKLRLSAILLRKKKITREQFETIDGLMAREGGRFGAIAVQQGVLAEDQLRDFLKTQVEEVLFDAFVWTEGEFGFAEHLELPEYAVTITVDLPNLIMEGARRIEEWEHCLQLLPDSSTIYRVVASPRDDKVTLTAEEWNLLFMINGHRTLDDLVRDSEDDPLNVYRIVYGLAANQLIEPVGSQDPALDVQRVRDSPSTQDDTMKQTAPIFHAEPTVQDEDVADETSLLITGRAAEQAPVVARLLISDGEPEPRTVALTESEYLVGRHRDNNIQINDLGVSGFHARIFRSAEGYAIEDLKSRNGIWVNGTRVFHATLHSGDTVRLGATDVKYEVVSE
ncbi:MAG TPA: DUF4388 domain-containing protein [Thermoanaerobaculia bacterium]|nr:DUF4388 domain-containing protein [Thermoanaerobaculia bacterium]